MPTVEDYRIAAPFALEELVAAANSVLREHPDVLVGRRTVRYYIQEGILPPPSGAPKYARYRYEHLLRLVLVRLLLAQGLRLDAIRVSVEDLARGGVSRMEAAVSQLLRAGLEREELLFTDEVRRPMPAPSLLYMHGFEAAPVSAEATEDVPSYWKTARVFRRIPLTDRVSLEVASGGDLESDLEKAAEALEQFLQNLRDTP